MAMATAEYEIFCYIKNAFAEQLFEMGYDRKNFPAKRKRLTFMRAANSLGLMKLPGNGIPRSFS